MLEIRGKCDRPILAGFGSRYIIFLEKDSPGLGPGAPGLRGHSSVSPADAPNRSRPHRMIRLISVLAGSPPERLYGEQWLFHGPPMQALTEVGPVSPDGISGTIVVRPLARLLRPGQAAMFHTDPIALDTFTHLLGCWGLDSLDQGDVIFPLRMGRLTIVRSGPRGGHAGRVPDPGPRG